MKVTQEDTERGLEGFPKCGSLTSQIGSLPKSRRCLQMSFALMVYGEAAE
jgi:hypothetical protein